MTAPLTVQPSSRAPLLPALARAWHMPANPGRSDRRLRFPAKRGWVEEHRFANGTRLLQEEALSVGEALDRIGYENRSYFARIFRERYGMHPGEVRQHLQSVVTDAS